ncbi:MAG TPA: rhomboid family intramembrane serine protease [Myxococcota bacterium]|nr:rhomboid family intramembrane serine protease [Myxococcota bacterium]
MIPIRDTIQSRTFPFVNYAFIGLCAFVFYLEITAGADLDAFVNDHALIPATFVKMVSNRGLRLDELAPFFTSMFLHAGFMHFAGNMLFLWVFGDNVEDRMGHVGYALFYLAGGVAAGAAHVFANPHSVIPTVGASGAIAAVMGAYMLLYPQSRVESLLIIFVFVRVISVPAVVWLGLWFVFQLLSGSAAGRGADQGGVAFFAHVGGFVFGAAVVLLLNLRAPPRRRLV